MLVDIIVAVRNEEQAIPAFIDKVEALSLPPGIDIQLVFVEDSSTDGTRVLLRQLAAERRQVAHYTIAPGFGQGPAIVFGLSRSRADAMIMMDVDGSHPVAVIPEMISGFLDGAQVVQCVRRTLTNRKAYRRMGAALYQAAVWVFTGRDPREQLIYYRLISADVARQLLAQPRYWQYLRFPLPRSPAGALRKIAVDTQERVLGESKYDMGRLINIFVDGILSQMSPPRFVSFIGLSALCGALLLTTRLWALGPLVLCLDIWLLRRNESLHQPDLLQRIRVLESGNAPQLLSAQPACVGSVEWPSR